MNQNDSQSTVTLNGVQATFFIDNGCDIIQRHHLNHKFYEERQLHRHLDFIFHNSTIIDVGSNVGNHSIYYSLFSKASLIYCFEPNPYTHSILEKNISINPQAKERISLEFSTYALSSTVASRDLITRDENNLGSAKLVEGYDSCDSLQGGHFAKSHVLLSPLDNLYIKGDISLIKIDVEGHELDVLKGAEQTIKKHKPVIAIEVGWWNISGFHKWRKQHHYEVLDLFIDTKGIYNYIVYDTGGGDSH